MAKESIEQVVDEEIITDEVAGNIDAGGAGVEGFFEKNKTVILGVIAAIALGIVGYVVLNVSNQGKSKEAQAAMSQAITYFEMDSLNLAMNGDGVNEGFIGVVDDYGSTKAGNLAKYYLGVCYLRSGQYAEAVEALKSYKKGDDMASSTAAYALGAAYEELNEYENAANAYIAASRTPKENEETTPHFLMDAARCWETIQENDKALGIYKTIKKKYPLSPEGNQVDKYIGNLGGEI